VKYFDSFKFESTAYHSIKYHFKSIDTWLDGICKSHCDVHKWSSANLQWAPGKNSIFAPEEGYDEADLDAPVFDEDQDAVDQEEQKDQQLLDKLAFFGAGNNPQLAKDALIDLGFKVMQKGM
jgi:hypothetical protein